MVVDDLEATGIYDGSLSALTADPGALRYRDMSTGRVSARSRDAGFRRGCGTIGAFSFALGSGPGDQPPKRIVEHMEGE